jgi:membrane protein YdbS with pleckstrin-like domain
MNWDVTTRQVHRWISVAFLAIVVAVTAIAAVQEDPAEWVFFTPLPALFLLIITGIYLFVLPYARRWRRSGISD